MCSISEENYITVGNIYQAISRAKSLGKDFVIFNLRNKSDDKSNQSFIYIAIKELEDVLTILDLKKNDVVATRPVRNNGKISLTSPITFKKNENAVAILCPSYSNKKWDDTNEVQEMQVIKYDCLH